MSNEYELGTKVGRIESDEATKRVVKFFIDYENQASYHAELHRVIGGTKTKIARALHILNDELEVMDSEYLSIPLSKPTRMVSVLFFKLKPHFYDFLCSKQKEIHLNGGKEA